MASPAQCGLSSVDRKSDKAQVQIAVGKKNTTLEVWLFLVQVYVEATYLLYL